MRLFYILRKLNIHNNLLTNHKVLGITDNSKEVKECFIFFAIKGYKINGSSFIKEAIKNGASTIVSEEYIEGIDNLIVVDNIKLTLANFLNIYYKNKIRNLKIIGVTGTNGKTTTTNILFNYFNYINVPSMLIGTLGVHYKDKVINTFNTTPKITDLYKYFLLAKKENIKYIFMEVSSHSIKELRVKSILFDHIIVTNVNSDHLDYHKNIEDYFYTKSRLLSSLRNKKSKVILNNDDINSKLLAEISNNKCLTYSIRNNSLYKVDQIFFMNGKTNFTVNNIMFTTNLIGEFNIYNLLSCIALIEELKLNLNNFTKFLQSFHGVEGRMDFVIDKNKIYVIDFAHTESAVLNVLTNLRKLTVGKLITVIGCGGNRDKSKRSLMGNVSMKYSDFVIFTEDNSRNELFEDIVKDITKDIESDNFTIIKNRRDALKKAIQISNETDIVAILGRGHERFLEINNEFLEFNDKTILKELLKK